MDKSKDEQVLGLHIEDATIDSSQEKSDQELESESKPGKHSYGDMNISQWSHNKTLGFGGLRPAFDVIKSSLEKAIESHKQEVIRLQSSLNKYK